MSEDPAVGHETGPGVTGLASVSIHLTTSDAAGLHQHLQANGVTLGELVRWPGVPAMFTFADRNGLEIVEQT